jgi:hypothetical protein
MSGAVRRTATTALSNATLTFVLALAEAAEPHSRETTASSRAWRLSKPTLRANPSPRPRAVRASPHRRRSRRQPRPPSHARRRRATIPTNMTIDDQRPNGRHSHPDNEPVLLVYELLDALDDTSRIAIQPARELVWTADLEYLRALQRKGREIVAHAGSSSGTSVAAPARVPGPELP